MKTLSFKSSHIKLTAGVIAISFSPLAVKLVNFTSSVSAFYRSFYAALFFLLLFLFKFVKEKNITNYKWFTPSLIAGIFLGIDLILYHKTIIMLGAGPATFLGNSQVIFITLFAALIFREKISILYYITVALMMAGLYMLTPHIKDQAGHATGYLLGLTVGLTYAGMLIGLRYAKSRSEGNYPELLSLAIVFGVSAIVTAVFTLLFEHNTLAVFDVRSHVIMLITAFFCQTLGWYLINNNITKIPAHEGSLLLILQPVLATVWGCILFSEPLGIIQILGIFITIAGITVYQVRYRLNIQDI